MKVNSGQAPSTLVPKYIGSDFDKVVDVATNIEDVKAVAKDIENVGIVADNIGAVSNTGNNIADVTKVSDNIDYVKDVAQGIEGLPVISYIGDEPPKHPAVGASWYCTTDGRTYVWYEDIDSKQWVESSPQSVGDDKVRTDVVARASMERSLKLDGLTLVDGSFELGAVLNSATDVILHESVGKVYSWAGAFPATVPAGSTPASTGGIGEGKWVSRFDPELREDWDGFTAELLAQAGISDDGEPDVLGNSKRVDAINRIAGARQFANVDEMLAFDRLVVGHRYSTGRTVWKLNALPSSDISSYIALNEVCSADWGITGNPNGEYAKLNSFIQYLSTSRKAGVLLGNVFFEQKLRIPSNVTLSSYGGNFSGNLIPINDAFIEFDAEVGDYSQQVNIKDLIVYGDRTTATEIITYGPRTYSVNMENVRLFDLAANKVGLAFRAGGDCRLKGFQCRPKAGEVPAACVIVDCAGTVDGVDHVLTITDPDLEGAIVLLKCVSGAADVRGWYGERAASVGIEILSAGSLTFTGGALIHSGGPTSPVINRGGRMQVFGAKYYDSTNGQKPKPYILYGDASRSLFVGVPQSQISVETTATGLPTILGQLQDGNYTSASRLTSAVMSKDETVKVVEFSMAAAGTPSLEVTVTAWVNSTGYGKSLHKATAMLSRAATSLELTPLTPLVQINQSTSANYNVALELTANNLGATADISCTLRLNGNLNQGQTPTVNFRVEVAGTHSECRLKVLNR